MLFHVLTMWSQLFIRQTIRPEAFAASFQTSEGEHQHAFLRKDRFEVRDKRYEGDAENFYKMVISNIFVLFYALTYKYELALMEPRESILVAAHNSLISEIRKNFL